MVDTFVTPKMDESMKFTITGEDAKPLFIDYATRNGKYTKEQIARLIWQKHDLPMFRGTIVDEVPFRLSIDVIQYSFKSYGIAVQYRFLSTD